MKASEYVGKAFAALRKDDKFIPGFDLESLILSHLETVERADKQALKGQARNLEGYLKSAGTTIPSLEQELAILRSALRLKEVGDEAGKEKP